MGADLFLYVLYYRRTNMTFNKLTSNTWYLFGCRFVVKFSNILYFFLQ